MSRTFSYCLITDRKLCREPLENIARSAERAGIDVFQLREKDLTPTQLLDLARRIRAELVRTKFVINGELGVAVAAGADGIHFQKGNVPIAAVRRHVPNMMIGYSAHSEQEIRAAEREGADYVLCSPVFLPRSKTSDLEPIGCETLARWIRGVRVPVFGLGGVELSNLRGLQDAGCRGAAGISLFLKQGYFDLTGMVI